MEMMLSVAIIAVLAAIVFPYFFRAREEAKAKACITNLREIEGARDRWVLSTRVSSTVEPGWTDIVPDFLKSQPSCPSKGIYTIGNSGTVPTCSVGTNMTPEEYDNHILKNF